MNRFLLVLTAGMVSGCAVIQSSPPPRVSCQEEWVLLPFSNFTETPQAGLRAETITENLLQGMCGIGLHRYPDTLEEAAALVPDSRRQVRAISWARERGSRFALSGKVHEWRYKQGADGEPAVGVALQILEVTTGKVLWSAVGSKSGFGGETVSGAGQSLIASLLKTSKLECP